MVFLFNDSSSVHPPSRILSLVPSQTELLYDLGLTGEVVGITKFCVHPPEWFRTKTKIGGTKTLDIEKIKALRPHLVLANKEENVRDQVEELATDFPVWVSDVNTLEDACAMIKTVGALTGKKPEAEGVAVAVKKEFNALRPPTERLRTAYLIWKDPFMTAGGDTFINDVMTKAGFENAFGGRQRYPPVTIDELHAADCRLVLLSSEPYPFKQKHAEELQRHLPHTKIVLVDGEMFSWYGSRLLRAPAYFQALRDRLPRS